MMIVLIPLLMQSDMVKLFHYFRKNVWAEKIENVSLSILFVEIQSSNSEVEASTKFPRGLSLTRIFTTQLFSLFVATLLVWYFSGLAL